jgi:hypothetical protein
MDQGLEAWLKLIGQQPQVADISQFWRPMFGQSMEMWSQALRQGAASPDALAQWKKFLDESVEAWSRVLGQVMQTEGFAAAMGRFLDHYLNAVGPLRKSLQSSNEEFMRAMNLPSRKQVTDLASQVVSLEARIEALEERIEVLIDSVARAAALGSRPTAPQEPPQAAQGGGTQ